MDASLQSTPLARITELLDNLLEPERFTTADIAWNGLQVEASAQQSVKKIGVAVDAGLSIIREAVRTQCDLLITHHGLFWGKSPSPLITGLNGEKVRTLLNGGCSLYASHLPLDGNMRVGNAAEIARAVALTDIQPAFSDEQAHVGVTGMLPQPLTKETVETHFLSHIIPEGAERGLTCSLLFGTETITRVGIATGSASSLIPDAKALGCDVFISGEPKHEAYHLAQEHEMNVVFAGHYFTETFGVRALGKFLEETTKIPTIFLDEPTGI